MRLWLLPALCACGRLGFGDHGLSSDGATSAGDAEIDAFELLREDGGVDRVCSAPLAPAEVIVARQHACARSASTVYCWGANASGQLGLGDQVPRTTPTASTGTFTKLAQARGDHTCAFNTDQLLCWGANGDGQLGLGGGGDRSTPTIIGTNWSSAAAGGAHTCGMNSGNLYCWGANARGQLGLGDMMQRTTPTMVDPGNDIWMFGPSTGVNHTCNPKRETVPISTWCWGANDRGQAGGGDFVDQDTPRPAICCDHSTSLGGQHSASQHAGPNPFTWGANNAGQLGRGDTMDRSTPSMMGTSGFTSISAGDEHTCMINSVSRALLCFGANDRGQLGLGMAGAPVLAPTQVGTDMNWQTVVAGGRMTCATKMDGRLFCWGANDDGQLGIGHTVQRSSPVQVCLGE